MDLKMTSEERETFLAAPHVGIMAVERADGPPLATPVWYGYEAGGDVVVVVGAESLKHRLVVAAGRFSLCAQNEDLPYKYVSVEGAITSAIDATTDDSRTLAHRYMGAEFGDMYVESTAGNASVKFTMWPERWFTLDYAKIG